ncbi:MAG TPA: NAD(P)H-dependent oxidoreductase [Bacillota bacterium]|nr:NAD(P)H-dependent oxidoreductase [Bacillota bacterium]
MRLALFNGSPRGKTANSERLIQWLSAGISEVPEVETSVDHLARLSHHGEYVDKLRDLDSAVIVFPLYTDCMPGIVMAFFERLETLRGSLAHLTLGFVVHSGFPEACQSRAVEKYLVWLTAELGAKYAGTVIMGGTESMRHMQESALTGKKSLFGSLGRSLATDGRFSPELVKRAAGMERLPSPVALLFKVIIRMNFFQSMWNNELKKNNAYERRAARPYQKP